MDITETAPSLVAINMSSNDQVLNTRCLLVHVSVSEC